MIGTQHWSNFLGSSVCTSSLKSALNWYNLVLQNTTEQRSSKNPENSQQKEKELQTDLPACFPSAVPILSLKLPLNSSYIQRLFDRSEGLSHLWVLTFLSVIPQAQWVSVSECPPLSSQHARSSFPTSAYLPDPQADLIPFFPSDDVSVPKRWWPEKADKHLLSLL